MSTDAGATYTSLESGLTGYADWTIKIYDLTAYIDNDVMLQFKGTSNASSGSYIELDNIIVQETPSCEAPINLMVAGITGGSAQLAWTSLAGETAWEIEYETTGFSQGSGTTVVVTENPFELEGLNPLTSYEFYVRANCGGEYSSWAGPFEFATPCSAYAIPFVEGFESGYTHDADVAGCLAQESAYGSQKWLANNTFTNYNRTARTGDWNAYLRYNNIDWMFIPVNLVSGQSYTVDLYARQDDSDASNVLMTISYGNAPNASAMTNEIVAPTGVVNGDYQKLSGHFTPATDGIYYVGIKGDINNFPYYISIDDIRIDVSSECLETSDLVVSQITDVTAVFGWTSLGTESLWDIEYGVDGFTQGTGTVVNGVNSNSYNAIGLTPNTDYQFYVRANCGTETSIWAGPYGFTTSCSSFTAPYSQNFDATIAPNLDACWSADIEGSTASYSALETTTNVDLSTPNSVKFQNSYDNDGDYYLISPRFTDLDAAKRIKFQAYKNFNGDANSGVLELGVMTDVSDYNTFVNVYTFDVANFDEDNWKLVYVMLDSYTGGEGHIVFKYQPGTSDYKVLYIDDFVYEVAPDAAPDCATNVQVNAIDVDCGNKGVQISWDAVSGAEGYRLTIGTTSGGNDVLDAEDLALNLSYELSETLSGTTYYSTVIPYNTFSDASGCEEESFTMSAEICFCEPEASSQSTYVNNFSTTNAMVNVSNTASGFASNGYGDYYDTMTIAVAANSGFEFTLELVGGSAGVAMWIDWNKDYSFDPATELVYETTSYTNGPVTQTVTVPETMADDDYRMRILVDYNDSTPGDNPCEFNTSRGEAEDYKITMNNTLSAISNTFEGFRCYPNPVDNVLYVSAQNNLTHIDVYNLVGQEVISKHLSQKTYQLDMSELKSGMYMVKISSHAVSKIIKVFKR
ncbi:MAG: fibronectin type III domain-containing protein [Flavobacteriaceae bacterium]|nr:fibronectin type III domain-containing protein [Flavobacteriaceae bacterium]